MEIGRFDYKKKILTQSRKGRKWVTGINEFMIDNCVAGISFF
jgi:hypothetical protein